jgi:hypothetical protein
VKLVTRHLFGRDYTHVEPVDAPPDGYHGYMAGGTFVWTSDGRFPSDYPLSLHDHVEVPGGYLD